jgi:hypothetical protein
MPFVSRGSGVGRRKPKPAHKSQGYFLINFGNGNGARQPGWLKAADEQPKVVPEPDRRRKGKLALTKIAEQLPRKLKRITDVSG